MVKRHPRISTYYGLSGSQASFDFVDVRILGDTPLFIDPVALSGIGSPWANACASTVQSFFQRVLDAITANDSVAAHRLLSFLSEDNATRLGYSARSKGSGVGSELADAFYQELSTSAAVKTGIITDIEDTALFIEGVGENRISDVTTNIIREHLASFTTAAANFYGIPLVPGIEVYVWDSARGDWATKVVDLPVPSKGGPLLLVPKSIARGLLIHDVDTYYRHYALNYLRDYELAERSPLVRLLKSGAPHVYKKDVEAKYRGRHAAGGRGVDKRVNLDATERNPDLLAQFKQASMAKSPVTDPQVTSDATHTKPPNYDALLAAVTQLDPGKVNSAAYERAVEALLNALFYPSLIDPIRQENIHEGRKRIDISYTNAARSGVFEWAAKHYPCANIFVECKNYSRPIANPEYDQLAGRFSPSRGKVGLLVYRDYEEKSKVLESCHDTAQDDRGFVLALDDADLATLVEEAKATGTACGNTGLLRDRFRRLTS
jgi:hypothetical protein